MLHQLFLLLLLLLLLLRLHLRLLLLLLHPCRGFACCSFCCPLSFCCSG